MGTYINLGKEGFQSVRNGEYIDKSGLIAVVNKTLFTEQRFSCVTRCRRFGKSMAANMPTTSSSWVSTMTRMPRRIPVQSFGNQTADRH
ncbi:MAG: hypothetical protein IKQ77_06340 [Prevotella sp.]|nr:hypothetical protein [Prevotella sp.]